MPRSHDDVACAATDHRYWSFSVMWCPHRQAFVITRSSHLETGTAADPLEHEFERMELGPFDSHADAVALLLTWIDSAQIRGR